MERHIKKDEIKRFMQQAHEYLEQSNIPNSERSYLLACYEADLIKYMFTFDEWYCQYKLSNASDKEKESYISRSKAQKYYRSIITPEQRTLFHDKRKFLAHFHPFIKHQYFEASSSITQDAIIQLITQSEGGVIIKPISGSLGSGIFKVTSTDIADHAKRSDIIKRIYAGNSLVEECIKGCNQLQAFHPQSLNTIRVVTVSDGQSPQIFGSFFRMGRGESVTDNAHAGGIYAHIDINNGIVDTDAFNTHGEIFQNHPDTNLPIKGFHIPKWELITKTCIDAHRCCNNFIVGWDVTVNQAGEVDFIEGNHAPDMDLMQGATKRGIRSDFESAFNSFTQQL